MKIMLYIKADTNDGDYVTTFEEVTKEQIEELRPIVNAIKNCKSSHNWGSGEFCSDEESPENIYKGILTEDQIELMEEYVPCGEHGVHTIDVIKLIRHNY